MSISQAGKPLHEFEEELSISWALPLIAELYTVWGYYTHRILAPQLILNTWFYILGMNSL